MLGYSNYPTTNLWSEMERLSREMSRAFEGTRDEGMSASAVFPPLNIYDNDEAFMLRAEIPGVDPSKLEVSATSRSVTIKGEREPDSAAKKDERSYHRRERDFGTFNRSFSLPSPIEPDKIVAHYKNGVLAVMLPKGTEARPRRIAVNG